MRIAGIYKTERTERARRAMEVFSSVRMERVEVMRRHMVKRMERVKVKGLHNKKTDLL